MSDAEIIPPKSVAESQPARHAGLHGFGVAAVALVAAILGGVVASFLPVVLGAPQSDRLAAAETLGNRLAASLEQQDDAIRQLREAVTQAKSRLDAMEMRLGAVEGTGARQPGGVVQRLAALETKAGQSADALGALTSRVNGVEAALPADLPQKLETFVSKNAAAALDTRLAKLEAVNTANTLRYAATMLALADLARAAQGAQPFVMERNALAATAPNDAALKIIAPLAERGVPAPEMLRARFPAVARAALNAERKGTATGLTRRLWNSVLELVSVRRVGNLPGDTSEARLARAQLDLDAGNLAAAAGEVAAVKGAAAPPLAAWLQDARARLDLDRAIADMKMRVTAALAASGAPPPAIDRSQGAAR